MTVSIRVIPRRVVLSGVPQWHPLGLKGGVVALLKTCRVVLGTYANVSIRVISCRYEAMF